MKKRYAVYGLVEWYANIDGCECNFKNGTINAIAVVPATYTTSDKKEQGIIENSRYFKSGKIKLDKVYNEPVVQVDTKDESPEAKVKTLQQARQFLMDMGVPMEELQSKAKVLEAAKEKGITFPNL